VSLLGSLFWRLGSHSIHGMDRFLQLFPYCLVYRPLTLDTILTLEKAGDHVDADMLLITVNVDDLHRVRFQSSLNLLLHLEDERMVELVAAFCRSVIASGTGHLDRRNPQ